MSETTISVKGYSESKTQATAAVVEDKVSAKIENLKELDYTVTFEHPIHEKKMGWKSDNFCEKTVKIYLLLFPCFGTRDCTSINPKYLVKGLKSKDFDFGIVRRVCSTIDGDYFKKEKWNHYATVSGVNVLNYAFGEHSALLNYFSDKDKTRVKKLLFEVGEYLEDPKSASKDLKEFQNYVAKFKNLEDLHNLSFPEKYSDQHDLKDNVGFKAIMALKDIYKLSVVQTKILAYLFANNNRLKAIKKIFNSKQHAKDFKTMLVKLRIFEVNGKHHREESMTKKRAFAIVPESLLHHHVFLGKAGFKKHETIQKAGFTTEVWKELTATPAVISWAKSALKINTLDEASDKFKEYKNWGLLGYIDRFEARALAIDDWNFAPLVLRSLLCS